MFPKPSRPAIHWCCTWRCGCRSRCWACCLCCSSMSAGAILVARSMSAAWRFLHDVSRPPTGGFARLGRQSSVVSRQSSGVCMKVTIVGAGVAGLTAAHELTRGGHTVSVYEAGAQPGGLASGFRDERWNWPLERFYHHLFTTDTAIKQLVDAIGFSDRL